MRKLLLVSAFAFVSLSSPARAQFCPGVSPWVFDDVLASDPFCGFITWMADNGITLGCQVIDANHRLYCPSDNVSRKQMAAFMNRLGNVRVEAVGTGPGLTGGPITSVGTINLATTQLLPTTACTNNQIARWNGSSWVCSTDANSGGTVTSVGSGTGLAGGPITASGALSIAAGYQLPQGCTNGQVAKSNGSNLWTCASDANAGGTVTSITAGAGLTGGVITTSGTIAVDPASTTLTNNFFRQGGNALGATAVLGTTDNNAIDVRVNGARVMRYEPNAISPNVIGGSPANTVTDGARGGTIGGGGAVGVDPTYSGPGTNRVTDNYGTIGGGYGNLAGDFNGSPNERAFATVSGGYFNWATGFFSTVGGGTSNLASGVASVVGGGNVNAANGMFSTVSGGSGNIANADYSAVWGGESSFALAQYSFAAGRRAKANASGAFAFADSSDFDFPATTSNEFAVRATGGARFVTAIDASGNSIRNVRINSNGELEFNAVTRQHLNLFGNAYAIGVQPYTVYFRSADTGFNSQGGFSWFKGGVHADSANAPGAGGVELMRLAVNGTLYVTGGTVGTLSDRSAKQDFAAIDPQEILARVVRVPVAQWSYKNNPSVRHIGPTSQDFRAAFEVGDDDARSIASVDADGVALAAIQALNMKVEEQAHEIAELRRMLEVVLARGPAGSKVAER